MRSANACEKRNTPIARGKRVSRIKKKFCIKCLVLAVFAFGFFLADETGPAEESKRTKRFQGWSRQILNFGFWDCICNFCDSFV